MAQRKSVQVKPLTLRLNGPLSPEKFLTAVSSFIDLSKEVSNEIVGKRTVQWTVSVKEGSAVFEMHPHSSHLERAQLTKVVQAVETGITALSKGERKRPRHFNDDAMESAKKLAKLASADLFVTVKTPKAEVRLSALLVASVERHLEPEYEDYGSVEGVLEVVSGMEKLSFRLRDSLLDYQVRCLVNDELESRVLQAFRKRVIAWGMIRYRADGIPTSIQVEEFEVFQQDEKLPTIDQFLAVLPRSVGLN